MDVRDDALERHIVAEVAVDTVQACGPTGHVIGLLLDDEPESRRGRARGRGLALALPAREAQDYSFVSKSSCP
jgi:hypothetical protein